MSTKKSCKGKLELRLMIDFSLSLIVILNIFMIFECNHLLPIYYTKPAFYY